MDEAIQQKVAEVTKSRDYVFKAQGEIEQVASAADGEAQEASTKDTTVEGDAEALQKIAQKAEEEVKEADDAKAEALNEGQATEKIESTAGEKVEEATNAKTSAEGAVS